MSTTSAIDLQAHWTLLGREMCRCCDRMNHHFRCAAGEVKYLWIIKHSIFISVNDVVRLIVRKGIAAASKTGEAEFTVHLYRDENTLLESYTLAVDKNLMCRLTNTEKRVPVREMCQRFLNILCTPNAIETLMQPMHEK